MQLIRQFVEGRLPLAKFAVGLTVAEYLTLSDEEEAALWDRWYAEANRQVSHLAVKAGSDAFLLGGGNAMR